MHLEHRSYDFSEHIIEKLTKPATKVRVLDICIGVIYTYVLLEDQRCGVALTLDPPAIDGNPVYFSETKPIHGCLAVELLSYLRSPYTIEAAVGLACVNALVNQNPLDKVSGDVLDFITLQPTDRVGMVGHFCPLEKRLLSFVQHIDILERVEQPQGNIYPSTYACDILPHCQVVFISATTLINQTLPSLLQTITPNTQVVLLGASTPLLPSVFRNTPITLLSGLCIHDPGHIQKTVATAGGMHSFKPAISKVNIAINR